MVRKVQNYVNKVRDVLFIGTSFFIIEMARQALYFMCNKKGLC